MLPCSIRVCTERSDVSITRDQQTQGQGSAAAPTGAVPSSTDAAVPSGNANAAMSPGENAQGSGNPEGVDLPEIDLQNEALISHLRKSGLFTREDFNRATETLSRKLGDTERQYRQTQEQFNAANEFRQFVEPQLRESLGDEEYENVLARFERDSAQARQTEQEQRESTANEWVNQEQQSFRELVSASSVDDQGQQLFNPQDPELISAHTNYMAAVRAAGLFQDPQSLETAQQWKRYARNLVIRKMQAGYRNNTQTQDAGNQAPQQTGQQGFNRGRQVTSPGGAGGSDQRSFKERYNELVAAGTEPSEAWIQAEAAGYTAMASRQR